MAANVRSFAVESAEVVPGANGAFSIEVQSTTSTEFFTGCFYQRTELLQTSVEVVARVDEGRVIKQTVDGITYTSDSKQPILLSHREDPNNLGRPAVVTDIRKAKEFQLAQYVFPNIITRDWSGDAPPLPSGATCRLH